MVVPDTVRHESRPYPYSLVDVFSVHAYRGNPLAVIHGGEGLETDRMQRIANWMNLSETVFILAPTDPLADYQLRIFTPYVELPFAGHPTLGASFAWLQAGGRPRVAHRIYQQCEVGLISICPFDDHHAFRAPVLKLASPVSPEIQERLVRAFGIERNDVLEFVHLDNGPAFECAILRSAEQVLAVRPSLSEIRDLNVALIGAFPPDAECRYEIRAFPIGGFEDTVSGALHASMATWLIDQGRAPLAFSNAQGTALGRRGRIHVSRDDEGTWIGGAVTRIAEGVIWI